MNETLKDVSDNELIAEVLRRGNRLVMVEPTTWVWGIKQSAGIWFLSYGGPAG